MKLRGLILKDVFELWAQSRILIVMIFIYLLIPLFSEGGRMLGSVAMLLLAMLPISALGSGRIDLSLHFSPANVSFRT